MAENKYNLYELQKKIPYEIVMPILAAWDEQSDRDITDLAKMAYAAGRNSISKEKNKMTENKMEAVAQLFGKKLGESFCVSCCNTRFLLKFTSDGLWVFDDSWGHWNGEDGMLESLLTGRAVIVDE